MGRPAAKDKVTHLHITADETTMRVLKEVNKDVFFESPGNRSAAIRYLARYYLLARRSFQPGVLATGTRQA